MKLIKKFDDYKEQYFSIPLHTSHKSIYDKFPDNVRDLNNIIFYGPEGIGKYTQALVSINKYSSSNLTYEKKISINFNKAQYYIKISDIHYEVDMSLLGCNTKLLWNEIYNQIIDIVLTKNNETGIIFCKNFQNISKELLEIFYSYMQTKHECKAKIIFVILTSQLSFIPENIIKRSKLIKYSRPTRKQYNSCLNDKMGNKINLNKITNINNLLSKSYSLMSPHENICNKIIKNIIEVEHSNFLELREILYDIFIYDLDIYTCMLYILQNLISLKRIKTLHIPDLFKQTNIFLQYYNNNYRPIYHLESYVYYLIKIVHDFK